MAGKLGLERLFRWIGLRSAPQSVDAADVGTAYGMELSFDSTEEQCGSKSSAQAAGKPAAPPPDVRRRR